MTAPRPKDLPYTALNSYGHAIYGLRFLYQLWPLLLVVLFTPSFSNWWLVMASHQTPALAALMLWFGPFARVLAIVFLLVLVNKMKKWHLASWNSVDAAMVALILSLGSMAANAVIQSGLLDGPVYGGGDKYQAILLCILFAGLILSGFRFPLGGWVDDLIRQDKAPPETPQIKGKIVSPPPAQLRDIDPKKLSADLSKRVLGQENIADQLAKSIARRLAQQRRGKPVFTGLFAGPTGVGKTEMAKAVAEALLGNEKTLFRVDCGNVLGEGGLQTLIGAPTGYMGSDKPGSLTAHVQRFPNAVLLFDEIEKAAGQQGQQSPLFRLLLALLDEGRFTEQSTGATIDATGCVILMTSNAAHKSLGAIYQQYKDDPAALTRATKDELQGTFAPEFLARIDLVTSFSPLDNDARAKVIAMHVGRIARQYDVSVANIDAGFINRALVQWQSLEHYGAREVVRWLEDQVADPIIDAKKRKLTTVDLVWNGKAVAAVLATQPAKI